MFGGASHFRTIEDNRSTLWIVKLVLYFRKKGINIQLNDKSDLNPYSVQTTVQESAPPLSLLVFRVLLVIAALNLLFHGALMTCALSSLFITGHKLDSYFYFAMFCKDAFTGFTALVGGIMVLCRSPLGWWFAVIHWSWYLVWKVIIAIVAETFAWSFPVRLKGSELRTELVEALIYSLITIVFFAWAPVMERLHVPAKHRFASLCKIFFGTLCLAFLINWWSGLR